MGKHQKEKKTKKYFDYSLLFLVIFLVGFGLVMLYSASAYEAQSSSDYHYDAMYFLKRQGVMALGGFVIMLVISRIPYKFWKRLGGGIYVLAFLLCAAVIPFGAEKNGSKRWLQIGDSFSFQPSEIAKVAVIIFLAMLLSRIPRKIRDFRTVIKVLLLVAPTICVIAYNNLSTAVIIAGICVLMLFVASPKYSHFFVLAAVVVAVGAIFVVTAGYRSERILAWLHPEDYPDKMYQTMQGLYAIGSGGLFGKGLGESIQKLGYVPEAQNDFIFTIICEELGLFGAVCVILLFILLLWRFMVIANNASDMFGALLVVGVMSHIALQVVLNLAVVTNSIPNTGVNLPFISYGGTSMVILLAEIGVVLSVSRGIRLEGDAPLE